MANCCTTPRRCTRGCTRTEPAPTTTYRATPSVTRSTLSSANTVRAAVATSVSAIEVSTSVTGAETTAAYAQPTFTERNAINVSQTRTNNKRHNTTNPNTRELCTNSLSLSLSLSLSFVQIVTQTRPVTATARAIRKDCVTACSVLADSTAKPRRPP